MSASLAGVPDEFDPGASYPLTVRIIEAPGAFDGVEPRGGFDLQASAGALITRGWDDLQVSQDGGEATHTLMGSHQLSWEVTWQAPQERDARVRFFLLVNRVDGSLAPDGGDHWARAGYTSTPAGFAAPAPPAGASTPDVTWAAAAAGALGAAAGFAAGRAVRRWPPRA